jgi:predicted PurR-regulated permease PerM
MAYLSQLPRWAIAGLAFPLICLNGWLLYWLAGTFQPATSIVITASLIAFLLDYPIDWLENRGLARGLAVPWWCCWPCGYHGFGRLFGAAGVAAAQRLCRTAARWIDQAKTQLLLLEDRSIFQNLPVNLDQLTVEAANQLTNALQATPPRPLALPSAPSTVL